MARSPSRLAAETMAILNIHTCIKTTFPTFPVDFPNFLFYKNLLLTITNTTKKELAKSVQPFTRDAVTKGNRDSFLYIRYFCLYYASMRITDPIYSKHLVGFHVGSATEVEPEKAIWGYLFYLFRLSYFGEVKARIKMPFFYT